MVTKTAELIEKIVQLTQQIDIIVNERQLRCDPALDQDEVTALIADSREAIDKFVTDFINNTLKNHKKDEMPAVINNFIKSVNDIGGSVSAEYLQNALNGKWRQETPETPLPYQIKKYRLWGLLLLLIVASALIGSVKLYFIADVSFPVLSSNGLYNAIRLNRKAHIYDDKIGLPSQSDQPFTIKKILLWPFSFSKQERVYYMQYLDIVNELGYELTKNGYTCATAEWVQTPGSEYSDDEMLKLINIATTFSQQINEKLAGLPENASEEKVVVFLSRIMMEMFPCRQNSADR